MERGFNLEYISYLGGLYAAGFFGTRILINFVDAWVNIFRHLIRWHSRRTVDKMYPPHDRYT